MSRLHRATKSGGTALAQMIRIKESYIFPGGLWEQILHYAGPFL
jgi:hypothetical protein